MPDAARPDAKDARRRLLAAIHATAKSKGLDVDTRRDIQLRLTGKDSCRDMTEAELRRVAAALNGQAHGAGGGQANRRAGPRSGGVLPDGPQKGKLRALWISGWHLGIVRDRTDDALASWLQRQTGLDAARWATPEQTARCIEALRDWLARDAGVDWKPYRVWAPGGTTKVEWPRFRVIEAQWRKLHALGAERRGDELALHGYLWRHFTVAEGTPHTALENRFADQLIRHFGERIRAAGANSPPQPPVQPPGGGPTRPGAGRGGTSRPSPGSGAHGANSAA